MSYDVTVDRRLHTLASRLVANCTTEDSSFDRYVSHEAYGSTSAPRATIAIDSSQLPTANVTLITHVTIENFSNRYDD